MSNVVFWRQVFLGASLFLCGGYPIIAAEVGDLTPNVGTRSLQQDGRRVICAISDKAGPIVGANVLVKGTTIGNISDMDGRVILAYIIHSGFISGYQNRYGDNLKPPTNVYHRMTA